MGRKCVRVESFLLILVIALSIIPVLSIQVNGEVNTGSFSLSKICSGESYSLEGEFEPAIDLNVGNSYLLWEQYGGWWSDAEKTKNNDDDDLMCWAASASNVLEWTGWGYTSDTKNADEIFQYTLEYWDDRSGWMTSHWYWWFNNSTFADVPGGGEFWPGYVWTDYLHEEDDPALALEAIEEYLRAGYGVSIGVWGQGHIITCWGFQYDPLVDKIQNPTDYYLGIWVTDSDDDKSWVGPAVDAPNRLRYLPVAWNGTYWKFTDGYQGWIVSGISGLEPYPGNSRPLAVPGSSYIGLEGTPITFDGSSSIDADGDNLMYQWDFDNDGLWDTEWSPNPTFTHTYSDDYSGFVVLNVRDVRSEGGLHDASIATVTVSNIAPVIDDLTILPPIANDPEFILPDVHETMFFGQSTDAGSDDLTFTWIWGDGTQTINTYSNDLGIYPFTQTDQASHTYADPGIYTIELIVMDDDGASVSTTYEITVLSAEEAKHAINDYIQALDDNAFKNRSNQRKNAFSNLIFSVDEMLDVENYIGAMHQLQNVREKADGSVDGLQMNDWVTHPNSQEHICSMIDALIAYLSTQT